MAGTEGACSGACKRGRGEGRATGGDASHSIVAFPRWKRARMCYEKAAELLQNEDAGDTEAVVENLQQVVDLLFPTSSSGQPCSGCDDHKGDDDDEEEFTEGLARALGATASNLLAKISEQEGTAESAIEHYERAIGLWPSGAVGRAAACLSLAKLLRKVATTKGAVERVEALLRTAVHEAEVEEAEAEGGEEEEGPGVGREAKEALAMVLCQEQEAQGSRGEGRQAEADALLSSLCYSHRLGREVLAYAAPTHNPPLFDTQEAARFVCVTDGLLGTRQLQGMLQVFGPQAAFWSEHYYDDPETGYFSYLLPLNKAHGTGGCGGSIIEEVVGVLWRAACLSFPDVATASHAEWWAHCRPHSSGHQLHYDSEDEGRGMVRHPVASAVLALGHDGTGGPTFVTDQRLGSGQLATKGWLVHPRTNRAVLFDARHLHGVIPGRGVTPDAQSRRITFMVGFWDGVKARPLRPDGGGRPVANMTMPSATTSIEDMPAWYRAARDAATGDGGEEEGTRAQGGEGAGEKGAQWGFASVQQPWEIVRGAAEKEEGEADLVTLPPYDRCFQGF